MADTLIQLDNTRKMSANCLLILSVEMIFIFDGFLFLMDFYFGFLFYELIKEGKRKCARKFNLSYHYTDDLIFSIIQDWRSSFLIFTPKDSQFLKPQNLLQLLFSNYSHPRLKQQYNNEIIWQTWCIWLPHCELSLPVKQYSISTSLWCLCISAHSLFKLFKDNLWISASHLTK